MVYGKVVKAGLHQASTIKVAEAAKVIENTQRDLNIALMNELMDEIEALLDKRDNLRGAVATIEGALGIDEIIQHIDDNQYAFAHRFHLSRQLLGLEWTTYPNPSFHPYTPAVALPTRVRLLSEFYPKHCEIDFTFR